VLIDLNADPGRGNLSARAYVASIVGPRRIVHGQKVVKRLTNENVAPLLSAVSGDTVMYFEVWLPQDGPNGGAFVGFSDNESAGQNSFQLLVSAFQRYQGILLPDDQLYGQVITDAFGNPLPNLSVIISSVVF
jgi:hypothetical protein